MGSIFFIAYSVDPPAGAPPRPITFLWNGGPGSNSAQVHVVGFGPKRVATADTYPEWEGHTELPLVDNQETWLEASDLVFIDPPGTGFSRAASKEARDILYTTHGDAEAVAEAIRIYLTRYDSWDQPLYIGGESYGTTRAMWVAHALERRRSAVDGVILISGGIDLGGEVPRSLRDALLVPQLTAVAHYHGRLPGDLQQLDAAEAMREADRWARSAYAPALEDPGALDAGAREAVRSGLARYTGIAAGKIDTATLGMGTALFADELLRDQGLELGRYDLRLATSSRGDGFWLPWNDPSLAPMRDLMEGTSRVFNRYVRASLGFESDLLYRGPFGKGFHPEPLEIDPASGVAADWMTMMFQTRSRLPSGVAPLRAALEANPGMRVLTLKGIYDGGPCALADEAVRAAPGFAGRVTTACLRGGHMWYSDREARIEAKSLFDGFIRR